LDIGDDRIDVAEWNSTDCYFKGPDRIWPSTTHTLVDLTKEVNDILRHGCGGPNCTGCYITPDGYCMIPFVFHSDIPAHCGINNESDICAGNLTANDINFTYWMVRTIENVSYGRMFNNSNGSIWTVEYHTSPSASALSPQYYVPTTYSGTQAFNYRNTSHNYPGTDDAIDDAVYRLLAEKLDTGLGGAGFAAGDGRVDMLDVNHDGAADTYFNPNTMWFEAGDELKAQALWGPVLLVKLVVWM